MRGSLLIKACSNSCGYFAWKCLVSLLNTLNFFRSNEAGSCRSSFWSSASRRRGPNSTPRGFVVNKVTFLTGPPFYLCQLPFHQWSRFILIRLLFSIVYTMATSLNNKWHNNKTKKYTKKETVPGRQGTKITWWRQTSLWYTTSLDCCTFHVTQFPKDVSVFSTCWAPGSPWQFQHSLPHLLFLRRNFVSSTPEQSKRNNVNVRNFSRQHREN